MDINAEMNIADDRALQRLRRAAGQAVRPVRPTRSTLFSTRAARVRDIGIKSAMYGRVFFVALGLVGALGAAAIYGIGAHLVVDGNISSRHARRAGRARHPRVPTADRADQRPRRPDDRDGQLRAGVRGARRPEAIIDRPGAVDLVDPTGAIEFDHVTFRYPAAAAVTVAVARGAERRSAARSRPRRAAATCR